MADWPTDKELEEIYRKGSEYHDFEFRPDAWDDMEKLLDNDKNRFGVWFRTALVIGLLALSYFSYNFFSGDNTSDQIESQEVLDNPIASNSRTVSLDIDHTNAQESAITINSSNHQSIVNSNSIDIEAVSTLSNNIEATIDLATSTIANNKAVAGLNSTSGQETHTTSNERNIEFNNPNRRSIEKNNRGLAINDTPTTLSLHTGLEKTENQNQSKQILLSTLPFSNDHINKSSSLTSKAYHLYSIPSVEKTIKGQDESFRRFFIGATAGVETSWTPNGDFSQIDYNLGIKSSYFVSPRWGFSFGASFQRDHFVAQKGDYKASESFWESKGVSSTPEFTQGRGNMLEFTLGTSFSFNPRNENGFSVSADIGNTIMLNEWYDFSFADESENFSSTWSMENHSLLSSINLSSNYRAHFANNVLVETGPYLRIPLSGIGHGNLRLSSIGLRVAVGLFK